MTLHPDIIAADEFSDNKADHAAGWRLYEAAESSDLPRRLRAARKECEELRENRDMLMDWYKRLRGAVEAALGRDPGTLCLDDAGLAEVERELAAMRQDTTKGGA